MSTRKAPGPGSDPRTPRQWSPAAPGRFALRRALAAMLVLATLGIAALAPGAGAPTKAPRRLASPDSFPAGPGREIAERACLICHSPMLVTQQAKDSTG